jgi:nucleotide-binding universal stress UspA family protein
MTSQILVPLDGSPLAETVLPHAMVLARATGSSLMLLRVLAPPLLIEPMLGAVPPPTIAYAAWEAENAAAHTYLAATAERLDAPDLPVHTTFCQGDPASVIVAWAAQDPPHRRIAMATHGRSGLGRWVFGSVAEKVLHAASVPLLLVRAQEDRPSRIPAHPYQTILVPLDGSALAEHALVAALPLARSSQATLWLLAVEPTLDAAGVTELSWSAADQTAIHARLEDYLAQVARRVQAADVPVRTHVLAGEPAPEILRMADQVEADLVVMSTHGRGGLQRFWLGSVALKVVQAARHPVLLVRA